MGTPTLIFPLRRSPQSSGVSRRLLGRGDAGSLAADVRVRERAERKVVITSGAEAGVEIPGIEAGESRIEDAGDFCSAFPHVFDKE